MTKREITLPPLEQFVADAQAGRFIDDIDAYLPLSLYGPDPAPHAQRRRTKGLHRGRRGKQVRGRIEPAVPVVQ